MAPKLKIIILSFDKKERTSRAVIEATEEIARWKGQTSVLLIHNGSAQKNVTALQSEFPQIEHLVLNENCGFSGGMNAGFRAAFADPCTWVLALSNDCKLLNEPCLEYAPALIGPRVYRRKSNTVESVGGYFQPALGQLRHARTKAEFLLCAEKFRYVPGSCFLIHRSVFEKTKGFDESLFTYWEDVDLSFRAHALGFPLLIQDEWHARHDIGKTCHGNPLYTLYYFQRNRIRLALRHTPFYLRGILLVNLTRDFFRLYQRLGRGDRSLDRRYLLAALRDGFSWRKILPARF